MKVCLVYPSIRNFGGFNTLGKHPECIYVNHGLASISAVLKQHGHDVDLIDLRECKDWLEVYNRMKLSGADVFGVYMSTLDFHEAKKIAYFAKQLNVKSIVGGPHPSICPEHTLVKTTFDYVFVGEAEVTLPKLIEDPDSYDRLVVGERPRLDCLPYEDREIFNMDIILNTKHTFYPKRFLTVISGRGCPYNCSFCKPGENKIFGKFRMRGIAHFMGEVEMLTCVYKYKMLMIDDDSFTIKPSYVEEFCDYYERIRKPFVCQTRVDFIVRNPDLVQRMKKLGLWMFVIGFESGSQRILNLLRKGTTVEQNLEAAEICREVGIKIWANIMYGNPTETKEEVKETLKMVDKIKPYHHSPSFYTPIVGTDLYDYCKENGLLVSEDPVHLGSRSPREPKIKGPDYEWLTKKLDEVRLRSLTYLPVKDLVKKIVRKGWRLLTKR